MGTTYNIYFEKCKKINNHELFILKCRIDSILERINNSMSTYIKTSTISKFNKYHGTDAFFIGSDMAYVIKNALYISKLSKGAFDITAASLIDLWGFDLNDKNLSIPKNEEINSLRSFLGFNKIILNGQWLKKLNPKIKINLSGIAKGYAVDLIYQFLRKNGFKNFIVEIGGEIRVNNKNKIKEWKIGICNPLSIKHKKKIIAIAKIKFGALATSGTYLNCFTYKGESYSHIIDPRTGWPIKKKLVSVSIYAPNCIIADALGTTAMILGEIKFNKLIKYLPNISALFVYKNSKNIKISKTNNFPS